MDRLACQSLETCAREFCIDKTSASLFMLLRGGRGAGWAGAVQLGGLVHEAHNISWDHI